MEKTPTIHPEAEALLRKAAYILANNALEGDEMAGKLSQDIHLLLNHGTDGFGWTRFLSMRKSAWQQVLEREPGHETAGREIEAINQAIGEIARTAAPEGRIVIDCLGGFCPVQAEGRVDGQPFYFRARGSRWSFSVGQHPVTDPEFSYEEPYGTEFEAGWMTEAEAVGFIWKGISRYRENKAEPAAKTAPQA